MDTINKIILKDNDGKSISFVKNPTLTQEGHIFSFSSNNIISFKFVAYPWKKI